MGDYPLDRLLARPILDTISRLQHRVAARFPDSGLAAVAGQLGTLAEEVAGVTPDPRGHPSRWRVGSRVALGLVVAVTGVILILAIRSAVEGQGPSGLDWLPLLESFVNDLVFASIAAYFLLTLPDRLDRRAVLALLHQIRSLAHIVDMHQLAKDPEKLRDNYVRTPVSEPMDLDRDQLERYLDYCSELLSLVGKTAALCAERSTDPVVLATVSDIEDLTTGMSRKIWQKIATLPPADQSRPRTISASRRRRSSSTPGGRGPRRPGSPAP